MDQQHPQSAEGDAANVDEDRKDWREVMTSGLRNHVVHKTAQEILSIFGVETVADELTRSVILLAEKSEKDTYWMAKSQLEYYHLIAQKIYEFQNELREKLTQVLQQFLSVHLQSGTTNEGQSNAPQLNPQQIAAGTSQQGACSEAENSADT